MRGERKSGLAPGIRWGSATLMVLALSGCGPSPVEPKAEPSEATADPTPTASPTPTPTEVPAVFAQPEHCESLLLERTLDQFRAGGLAFLGGPGGSKYGDEYLADPTPEQTAGGITCIWGDNQTDEASLAISVAPLSPATRPSVVADLLNQGLNEDTEGKISSYWQLGDEDHEPAILNVIRNDSWISVIRTPGGQDLYDEAVDLSNEVAEQVYR